MISTRFFRANKTIRSISLLSGGNIVVQLIPIVFAPLLSRIYSPIEYGAFSSYYVVFGIFSIIATGRYEYALLHPKSENNVSLLVKIAIYFSLFFGVVIFFVAIIYSFYGVVPLHYMIILPLSVVGIGVFQTYSSWLNRYALYKKIIYSKLVQNLSKTFIELLGGVIGWTSIGLFIGHLLGIIFSNIYLLFFSKLKVKIFDKSNTKNELIMQLKLYKDYPLYNLPFSFMDRLAASIPLLFISTNFSTQNAGYFGFTERIIYSPFALISAPISMVLMKEVSELYREHKPIDDIIKQITKVLIYLSVIPFLILLFFSNVLFSKIFGAEWIISGNISTILAFSFIVKSIISPLSNIFIALNQPKKIAQWQTIYLLLHLLGVGFSLYFNIHKDIYIYTGIVVIVDLIAYAIYYFMIYNSNQNYHKQIQQLGYE